jgi:alpha-beta hydrolase superfamily lysophospholipase
MTGALRAAFAGALLLLASACAPTIMPMGPPTAAPQLLNDRIVAADGAVLPLRIWMPRTPPKAVILGLHGFNDYAHGFDQPGTAWAEDGIVTYAYDQRGFGLAPNRGLWPGSETLIADMETALRLLRTRHPGLPLYLCGESMGAAVAMAAAADGRTKDADGIILVAPAVRGREDMGPVASAMLWLTAHTLPDWAPRPRDLGFHPSDNIPMLRAFSADPLVIKATRVDTFYGLVNLMDEALDGSPKLDGQMLILLGANDDLIPDSATDRMLERLPQAPAAKRRVANYAQGYHMLLRDLQAPRVHRDVASWIATRKSDPAASLPSGADQPTPPANETAGNPPRTGS